MTRVVPHPRQPLDDQRHAWQRPQLCGEAMTPRALEQGGFDPRELRRLQPRLAPRTACGLQGGAAIVLPGMKPAVGGGARGAQRAGDGRLRLAARKQPRGLVPTRFQRSKIPTGSAAGGWHALASQGTR